MSFVVPEGIEAYAEAHTTPVDAGLADVAAQTHAALGAKAGMLVGALEGRFLEFLVFSLQPKLIVEVGTFTGYSALSMANALPAGGRIITCEIDTEHAEIAKRNIAALGRDDVIEVRVGPAVDTLASIDGPVDFAFIDADKTGYAAYYEALLPKLAPRGVIAVDNTLWSGRVVDDVASDPDTVALRAFNEAVVADERVVCAMLSIRDGVTLIRRR
ncbi:MAG: caffeoyl-CoA O-methyltransferase [Actinomycetota bacterium]|jgi:caffeoyl-CoA O-methyltransferase